MSVESILDYFHDRNVKKSTDILMHHYQLLQEEIRQKMLLSKTLSRKLLFLKELAEPPVSDVVFECRFPKRYMITFGEEQAAPGNTPMPSQNWSGIWMKPPRFWPATG